MCNRFLAIFAEEFQRNSSSDPLVLMHVYRSGFKPSFWQERR